jgi:Zn finger protein HypA/HybF involved in hydrogenase expression
MIEVVCKKCNSEIQVSEWSEGDCEVCGASYYWDELQVIDETGHPDYIAQIIWE